MDVLSDLIQTMHVHGSVAVATAFAGSWGFHVPANAQRAPFYIVQHGSCYIDIDGVGEQVLLQAGEVLCLPHGSAHAVRATPGAPVTSLDEALERGRQHAAPRADQDTANSMTFLIGGAFTFYGPAAQPLRAAMEPLIHLRPDETAHGSWLAHVTTLLCMEAERTEPGGEVARAHLMDVLFIHLIRGSMAQHGSRGAACNGTILRAVFDGQMSPAVELIHRYPERKWTVAQLAAAVNMSRTAFAMRFSSLAGVAPLTYARQWRLLKASDMLANGETSLGEIATRVGYESVAAFSAAFKRELGVAPGSYRHQRRTGGQSGMLAAARDASLLHQSVGRYDRSV